MTAVPLIPDSAPFSPEQRSWLNGFLAGILSRSAAPAPAPASAAVPLLVLFGSQSGNAESLAKKIAKEANARGFSARAAGMDAINAAALAAAPNVLVITSTWGEGDMPDNAAGLWDQLNQNGSSPRLETLRYSVLALGDRNYADTFCLAGRKMDERLAELGAVRVHPRQDCDVDFEAPAKAWSSGALEALLAAAPAAAPALLAAAPAVAAEAMPAGFSKKNPCMAPLLENRLLNARGSAKDTRHIAFALPESGMEYEAGDALGVFVSNCPGVVDQVLHAHDLSGDAVVQLEDGPSLPLREALRRHFEIRTLLGVAAAAKVTAQEFIAGLRKLQPRLYSISSSPKAHPGEVHLTVSAVRYEQNGIAHKGVASTFLADRLPIGDTAPIFVQKSAHFRLPADGSVPVIMVGPGTGIAPFRAFLEERLATGAAGRNWLFFGDQRRATDYLYSEQITEWQRRGHLTRLDLAFSRDQKEKIYVQNRMLEHAAELWSWLEEGAHFYVCGDASRMAKDVDAALHDVIRAAGGKSADEAAAFVAEMKRAKRYLRDVY